MRATVVVPTRDRPGALAACLAALRSQTLPVEVIVVDDGSRESQVVASLAAAASARMLTQAGSGPAAARNAGVEAAAGDVVCFVDDDCLARRDWAERICSAVAASPSGLAAGRTVAPPGAPPGVVASQVIIDHLTLEGLGAAGTLRFAPSCNLAGTLQALSRLPFDETFPAAAAEDREWSARACASGASPDYAPDAIVVHRQAPGALAFTTRQLRYGGGAQRLRARSVEARDGTRILPEPPGFYARLLRRGFAAGARPGALVGIAQLLTIAGAAWELGVSRSTADQQRLPVEPV